MSTATLAFPASPTTFTLNSAATTNATAVKTSAGVVYSMMLSNSGAAVAFVKLYNKASAPTVGTDIPVMTVAVPATGSYSPDFSAVGYTFTTGIALAITNLSTDADATAVTAGQVKVALTFN